ncbi:outer membrane beta-barrel protein [Ursidibacter arcticus]
MKKVFVIASLVATNIAMANNTFTGWYVGGELNSTKHSLTIPYSELGLYRHNGNFEAGGSRSAGIAVLGGYGFDFSEKFVGLVEGKVRLGNATTKNRFGEVTSKEKYNLSVSYLQGYRLNNFLPYIKLGAQAGVFDMNEEAIPMANDRTLEGVSAIGFEYGVGVRYIFANNLEAGIEYSKATIEGKNSIKFKTDTLGVNVSYRF